MQQAESSTSFSIQELVGRIGEVTVPIPAKGYGEVMIIAGLGYTNQIAASFDQEEISADTRIVVIATEDGVLLVSRFEHDIDSEQ